MNPTEEFDARRKAFFAGYHGQEQPILFWRTSAYLDGQHAQSIGIPEKDAGAYFERHQILDYGKYWP